MEIHHHQLTMSAFNLIHNKNLIHLSLEIIQWCTGSFPALFAKAGILNQNLICSDTNPVISEPKANMTTSVEPTYKWKLNQKRC